MKIFTRSKPVVIAILLLASTTFFAFDKGERFFEIAKNLDIFATMFKELNTYYVDEINPNKAIKTSIDALLKTFDPYTVYYAEDDIEDYMTMTTGKYNGIGASVLSQGGKHQVMMLTEGSPAEKAGLKIGDEILKIDGIDIVNSSKYDIGSLLKGQTSTTVKLTVKRYGKDRPEEVVITRDIVKTGNVPYYGMINSEVGYIDLKDFTATAAREMKDAFKILKDKGMKKLILDVRDNPGGLMQMAIEICNMFIEKDNLIVSTKGKVTEWNKDYMATMPAIDKEIPIVVITNSRSASAAEIVAGTIQDYDRGVLLGQRSFGKGLVQVTRDLSFNAKLKVTTAKYYIASGRCIQAIDYSHRNADGSVGKLPDSLRTAFKTKSGRTVYDGGGVSPDVEVERQMPSAVIQALTTKGLFYGYANKYAFEHATVKAPRDFILSDIEYQDFVKWVATKDFSYTTQLEKSVNDLEASAQKEKSLDIIQEQVKMLKAKIKANKLTDLQTHKDDIKYLLEEEILTRYYLQKGIREHSFARDLELQATLKLFNDMPRYQNILKAK
jgi:carboxyl-terminal processing protease